MTEPTTTTPAVPLPSQEEIDAAVRTLMRAWSPSTLLPGDPEPEDDEDGYDADGCGCAGEDEYGEPLGCNCGDGCSCDSCDQYRHARAKICQAGNVSVGTRCVQPTRYLVTGYRLNDLWTGSREAGDCPHTPEDGCPCANGSVFIKYGAKPNTHQTLTACSIEHAQALIARMNDVYKEPDAKPNRLRWYFEPWTYVPHYNELPAPLAAVRERIDGARACIRAAVEGIAERGDVGPWWQYARQDLARAAWHVARPLERPEDDVDQFDDEPSTPLQEEPSDPWPAGNEPSGGAR